MPPGVRLLPWLPQRPLDVGVSFLGLSPSLNGSMGLAIVHSPCFLGLGFCRGCKLGGMVLAILPFLSLGGGMANSMPRGQALPWLGSAPPHVTLKILINSFNDVGGGLVTRVLGCFSAYQPGLLFLIGYGTKSCLHWQKNFLKIFNKLKKVDSFERHFLQTSYLAWRYPALSFNFYQWYPVRGSNRQSINSPALNPLVRN